jgi:hypothetical protein
LRAISYLWRFDVAPHWNEYMNLPFAILVSSAQVVSFAFPIQFALIHTQGATARAAQGARVVQVFAEIE